MDYETRVWSVPSCACFSFACSERVARKALESKRDCVKDLTGTQQVLDHVSSCSDCKADCAARYDRLFSAVCKAEDRFLTAVQIRPGQRLQPRLFACLIV